MSAEIHTHAAWSANLDALKQAGVDVKVSADYEDILLTLPEPAYGETILGDLNREEKVIYAELKRCKDQFEQLGRTYIGRSLERFGGSIRSSDINRPLHEAVDQTQLERTFESEEEKREFFRLERKIGLLHHTLYWGLCERFNCHEYGIGVRSRFRAVRTAERA